jgi:pyruvate/2-oxoglutarate dehydrogenase complex dihydrolipoamide acyltransferase (E2) component
MGKIDYNKLSACVLEKHLFTNDRQCIVKDPTAELLEIVQVVDKKYAHVFDTTKIELKFDGEIYMWQVENHACDNDCPPCERQVLLRFAQQRGLMDHIVCFAYQCDKRARKYNYAAAAYAAAAAAYAADAAAAAADAAAAAYAADAAAAAAAAAAAYAAAAAIAADAAAAAYAADADDAARHTEYEWQIGFLRTILAEFGVNEVV